CSKYGPPEILQVKEVEKPVPKDNELLIKVHAATVNRTDCGILRAKPFFIRLLTGISKPKKQIPGTEFAGVIEAVGTNVTSFKIGDKVFGFDEVGSGSHAEYMIISEDKALTTIPGDIPYEQAAASTEGAYYAYNFINKVNLKSGQKVLVNGATGAIGSAAVQLLKYFGADVTAVCRGEHFELVKSLGANKVFDYTQEDFTKDDQTYSFVFDAVGKSSFAICKPLLEQGGVYISSELGFMAQNVILAITTKLLGSRKVRFPVPTDCRGIILFIKKLMEEGKFRAVIDRGYPLEQIVEAFQYVEKGQKTGNVVITFEHKTI
ncbi:MAG: NAD(P)-dependent alcohol dehydrogenase, partial [Candidatus Aegiribacteria sp.]|nr:NAD(P)-dependent alcohol dehydrogenase [Candidatus Aegiribacteria sp.]